ncbi:MAG TPA: SCO family protein [Gemmatimonadaceae bacterium]|nr:SCO family protein [Gemmatimonadaceae bacterium]
MEDRVEAPGDGRPGAAFAGLVAILAITASWWALALAPVGRAGPDWLERTRAACFGAAPGGLPDAGGWILLLGEPLGMIAVLLALWGGSVRRQLRWIASHRGWRLVGSSAAVVAISGAASLGVHVARVWASERNVVVGDGAVIQRLNVDVPRTVLVDQRGVSTSLSDLRGQAFLLTFAFGHCSNVCPAIIAGLREARVAASRPNLPLVVITLDPWRDTPDRLGMMSQHWALAPEDRVLSGGVADVEHVLDVLGVGRKRDEATGDIVHGTTTMIVNERSRIILRIDGGWSSVASLLRRSVTSESPIAMKLQ